MTKQTLFVTQGTDFSTQLSIRADDGTPANITGYVFNSAIRQNPFSNLPTDVLSITVTDAPNGNLTISFPAGNSSNIQYGQYLYIVTQKDANNITSVLRDGQLIIIQSAIVNQPALPNVANQILNDHFTPVFPNQNTFYLSFAPANTSNVTIVYNGSVLANTPNNYTISGTALFFNNNGSGGQVGDEIRATEIILSNE